MGIFEIELLILNIFVLISCIWISFFKFVQDKDLKFHRSGEDFKLDAKKRIPKYGQLFPPVKKGETFL